MASITGPSKQLQQIQLITPSISNQNGTTRNPNINIHNPGDNETFKDSLGRKLKEMNLIDPESNKQKGFNQEQLNKLHGKERRKAVLLLRQWNRITSPKKHPSWRNKVFALFLVIVLIGVTMNIDLSKDTSEDNDDTDTDPVNHAPQIHLPGGWGMIKEGESYESPDIVVVDEDGDNINASLDVIDGPAIDQFVLIEIDKGVYQIQGNPSETGIYRFRLWYGDGKEILSEIIELPVSLADIVEPINNAPEVAEGAQTQYNITVNKSVAFDPATLFTDKDNDSLKIECDSDYFKDGVLNITKPGKHTINFSADDGKEKTNIMLHFNATEKPIPQITPFTIGFNEEDRFHFQGSDFISYYNDSLNVSYVSLTDKIHVKKHDNGSAEVWADKDFDESGEILMTVRDKGKLISQEVIPVNITPVYDPMEIQGFNLTQDSEDGNFYNFDLSAKAIESDIDRVEIRSGDELIETYPINSKTANLADRLNFSSNPSGNLPINITAISKDNRNVTIINNYIPIPNDLSGNMDIENGTTDEPTIKGNANAVEDGDVITEVNSIVVDRDTGDELKNVTYNPNTPTFEFSYSVNTSDFKDEWDVITTIYDSSGGVLHLNGSGSAPDDPAEIYNIGVSNTRKDLNISFTVEDSDSNVTGADIDVEGVGIVAGEAVDGDFDEQEEEVEASADISHLNPSQTYTIDIDSSGGESSTSFYIPKYASQESLETSLGYRKVYVESQYKADLDIEITDIDYKIGNGANQEADIIQDTVVDTNITIDIDSDDVERESGEVTVTYFITDNVDIEDIVERTAQVDIPGLPEFGEESVEQTNSWYNLSIPFDTKGIGAEEITYQIEDGSWENGEIDENTGRIKINTTNMIGTYNGKAKLINKWGDEVIHNFQIYVDPVPIYKDLLGVDNTKFINEVILDTLDGESPETYEAFRTLVNKFDVDKRDLCIELITGLSNNGSAEIQTVNKLYEAAPDLVNLNIDLTYSLFEVDEFQKASSLVGNEALENIINGFTNLNQLEENYLFMQTYNRTATDSGDLLHWLATDFADTVGIDASNTTQFKIILAYWSVYDGLFNNNKDIQDNDLKQYIIDHATDAIGIDTLKDIATSDNAVVFLQDKVDPTISGVGHASTKPLDRLTPISEYQVARDYWQSNNLDELVLGKNIPTALSNIQEYLSEQTDHTGNDREDASKFWGYFNETKRQIFAGENPDVDCDFYRECAIWLFRAQNHLGENDSEITDEKSEFNSYLTVNGPNEPNHSSVSMYQNNETSGGVDLVNDNTASGIIIDYKNNDPDSLHFYLSPASARNYEFFGTYNHGSHSMYGMKECDLLSDYIINPYWNVEATDIENIDVKVSLDTIYEYVSEAKDGGVLYSFKNLLEDEYELIE